MPPAWSIMQYRMKFVLLRKRARREKNNDSN
jgi:hypothetical protein